MYLTYFRIETSSYRIRVIQTCSGSWDGTTTSRPPEGNTRKLSWEYNSTATTGDTREEVREEGNSPKPEVKPEAYRKTNNGSCVVIDCNVARGNPQSQPRGGLTLGQVEPIMACSTLTRQGNRLP